MYGSKRNNKKKFIIIAIILILLLVIGIVLYLKMGLFKTDQALFNEYFMQNLNNINTIIDISKEKDYIKTLEEKSYSENTNIDFSYINNDEQQETFTGVLTGARNTEENKSYKDLKVKLENTDIIEVKYLQDNSLYGLNFADVANMYATIDISKNMTGILKYFGIEQILSVDKIGLINLSELINISEEEKQEIASKYLSIVLANVQKKDYSSQKEKVITLSNGESITTNCYILTVNVEDMKKIYKEAINQLSTDEIIMSKIENIDSKIKEMGITLNKDLKTLFEEFLNEKMSNINIQEELVVNLYELNGKSVRTVIQYGEKAIELNSNDENSVEIKFYDLIEQQENNVVKIIINKSKDTTKIEYHDFENRNIELTRELINNTNNIKSTTNIQYGDNNIKNVDIKIDKNINLQESILQEALQDNATKRILNDYNDETLKYAMDSLGNMILKNLSEKRDKTNSLLLKYIIEYNDNQANKEKEEQEKMKKRFNNQFVPYSGNKLDVSMVYNLLDEVERNILNYQMVGEDEIRIYIKEGNENEELIKEIKDMLNQEYLYNIRVSYDENEFVNQVIINRVKKE